jgi:hypothetical protein
MLSVQNRGLEITPFSQTGVVIFEEGMERSRQPNGMKQENVVFVGR